MNGTIQITGMTLEAFFSELDKRYGGKVAEEIKAVPVEMNTRQVKQHLLEKGYKLKSTPSLINFVKERGLTRKKRGKEFWYLTSEIESIPSRLIHRKDK